MKVYPTNSVLTIRQRIEKAYIQKRKHDVYVSIHDDTDGDGFRFGFYLSEWEWKDEDGMYEFQQSKELDYRLDVETKSAKYLSLGFNGNSPHEAPDYSPVMSH